jgi:hypothetical protein
VTARPIITISCLFASTGSPTALAVQALCRWDSRTAAGSTALAAALAFQGQQGLQGASRRRHYMHAQHLVVLAGRLDELRQQPQDMRVRLWKPL